MNTLDKLKLITEKFTVSRCGTAIINNKTGKILKQTKCKLGYVRVFPFINSKRMNTGVHQLVAYKYCKNPTSERSVNHIDGDKGNNIWKNLEWISHSANLKHSYEVLRNTNKKKH